MKLAFLGKYREGGLLLIRIGFGIVLMVQSAPQMFGGPRAWAAAGSIMRHFGITFSPVFWGFLLSFAEFFGGVFLVLGLLFRPACLLIALAMLLVLCLQLKRGESTWRIVSRASRSEAFQFVVLFTGLALVGPGKYSVDKG